MASKSHLPELAEALREARRLHGMGLRQAALRADLSPTYLTNLESGLVKEPSPHVLHRLAKLYGIPYSDLMRFARYLNDDDRDAGEAYPSPLEVALRSAGPVTEQERADIAAFLAILRSHRREPAP